MKRARVILMVVFVLLLGGMTAVFFIGREPRYKGRTLSEWIQESAVPEDESEAGAETHWEAATNALQHIRKEAMPWLMKWGTNRDSFIRAEAVPWINDHLSQRIHFRTEEEQRRLAWTGFRLLGLEPRPLWIVYADWADHRSKQFDTFDGIKTLRESGAPKEMVVPAYITLIHDPKSGSLTNIWAIEFIRYYPKEAEAAGVFKTFPGLKPWQPSQAATNQAAESK